MSSTQYSVMDSEHSNFGQDEVDSPFKSMKKLLRGFRRYKGGGTKKVIDLEECLGFTEDIGDIPDVTEEDLQENYQKMPPAYPVISRKEMLSDVYKMDYPRRGKAVVINNKNFTPEIERQGYGERAGTDVDATKICSRLKLLGFEVERHHDATRKQMLQAFQDASSEDHSDADCFVGVILSHGELGYVFGSDGQVEIEDILQHFKGSNCPSLAGKPKLFFIQACRGRQLDSGVGMNVIDAQRDYNPLEGEEIRIPNEADILVSYSTVPGYYSWRNNVNGSWYIEVLVEVLDQCGTEMEFQKLLTRVHRLVSYGQKFMSNASDPRMSGKKQIPSYTSMLTKDLYFVPKKMQNIQEK